ncbi:MAG: hypothetical protein CMG75_08255 [Candidatus Marinimicrobia bacterium]|nr:hypothetical protein [Candidatus Neomarinimicrobiota bacterium]|tara:strand:+ start:20934 stop:21443 length:510 start_codon:yes stop_codon:yes gene_type:complete
MENNEIKSHWIAIYTKPRHEKKAEAELKKKGIASYLPLVKRQRFWKDRKKWVWMPLFRSYLFVHVPLNETIFVLQTHGVHHIVKMGGDIAIVPNDQVDSVKRMLEGGYVPDAHDYFDIGDEVEIGSGPLLGLKGVLSRREGESRFVVRIDGIQQAISVHIDADMLKPIK